MKKITLAIVAFVFSFMNVNAQNPLDGAGFAVKTNLLYDFMATINVGAEFRVGDKMTVDIPVNINFWDKSYDMQLKHFMVQPEFRYWLKEEFDMHFFGAHLVYANYDIANISLPFDMYPGLKNARFDGNAMGIGLSYGYHLYVTSAFRFEGTIGLGYIHTKYDRYDNSRITDKNLKENYFGPTKLGISLVYMIGSNR